MDKLLVITGPTATGKTALGIELAQKFNGEILSADSRQVYKGKDVETGKDKKLYQKAGVPVWGIDVVSPNYNFNIADYVRYAQKKISEITSRGKLPIVVGGSGHYLRGLLTPFATINIPPNQKLRQQNLSVAKLQEKLQRLSPKRWQQMNASDRQNPRRLIRAIETQTSRLRTQNYKSKAKNFDALVIGLTAPREVIYQKIAARRKNRADLIPKEQALVRRQLAFISKFLKPVWFDITNPGYRDKIIMLVEQWYGRKKS